MSTANGLDPPSLRNEHGTQDERRIPAEATRYPLRPARKRSKEATAETTVSRRSSIRPLTSGNEPPWGVEPQTYALRVRRTPPSPSSRSPSVHVKVFTVHRTGHRRTPLEATKEATAEIENTFRAGMAGAFAASTRSS